MAMTDHQLHGTKIDQACAVPFRYRAETIEVCLITSSAGRWIFPKGVVHPDESLGDAALKEALEEAGLHGHVTGDPLGCYEIFKNGGTLTAIALLMEVSQTDDVWDEADSRERRWVSLEEAYDLVSEPQLCELLDAVNRRVGTQE